jgi:hypothetical protein
VRASVFSCGWAQQTQKEIGRNEDLCKKQSQALGTLNINRDWDLIFCGTHWRRECGSWELSLLAYKVGEQVVQRAIDQTGSRNVWVLIKAGAVNDRNYVAKVMAAALIVSNSDRFVLTHGR